MLKILVERWDRNRQLLVDTLKEIENIDYIEYKDLVKITFSTIFNGQKPELYTKLYDHLDIDSITEIDDGSYQGTLLYLIPFKSYSPSPEDYLMTYVYYGSCTGCDILQSIMYANSDKEEKVSELVSLCKDIITNTIKPYNYGWRYNSDFDHVVIEDEKNE